MNLNYQTNQEVKEALERSYKIIKEITGASHVINTDIYPIYSYLNRNDLEYSTERTVNDIERFQVWTFDNGLKVAVVNFEILGRTRDPYLKNVVSKNSHAENFKITAINPETKTITGTHKRIYYCDTEEHYKIAVNDFNQDRKEREEWQEYEKIKDSLVLNGKFQPVGKSVYMYFLECVPPTDFAPAGAICGEPLDIIDSGYTRLFFYEIDKQFYVTITNKSIVHQAVKEYLNINGSLL